MRERCTKCGRLLPIGQLHRVDGQLVCIKEGACRKAQEKLALLRPPHTPDAVSAIGELTSRVA